MDPLVAPYVRMLDELRRQVTEALAPLNDEQINRTVPGLRNSVGILLKHMAGSERYWIVEVVGGTSVQRNRDSEFEHTPVRKADMLVELERVGGQTRDVLGRIATPDLLEEMEVRGSAGVRRETKAGALLHATQHIAYHLGQLRYLAKLVQA